MKVGCWLPAKRRHGGPPKTSRAASSEPGVGCARVRSGAASPDAEPARRPWPPSPAPTGRAVGAFPPRPPGREVLDDAFAPPAAPGWLIDSGQQTFTAATRRCPRWTWPGIRPGGRLGGRRRCRFLLDFQGDEHVLALIPSRHWVGPRHGRALGVGRQPAAPTDPGGAARPDPGAAPSLARPRLRSSTGRPAAARLGKQVWPRSAGDDFQALEEPVGGIREIKSLQQTMVQMASAASLPGISSPLRRGSVTRVRRKNAAGWHANSMTTRSRR